MSISVHHPFRLNSAFLGKSAIKHQQVCFAGNTSGKDIVEIARAQKIAPVQDDSLKPVDMEITLERVNVGPKETPVFEMRVNGHPWRFNPTYNEVFERIDNYSSSNLNYPSEVSHDILEHILTPWVSPLPNRAGEYLAGRMGVLMQGLIEGDMAWQGMLLMANDAEVMDALYKLVNRFLESPSGETLIFQFQVPPPDRYFSYPDPEVEPARSERWYNGFFKVRVDDKAVPTGHSFKPITLTGIESTDKDNSTNLLIEQFAEEFQAYQNAIAESLIQGDLSPAFNKHFNRGLHPELRSAVTNPTLTMDGTDRDFRYKILKKAKKEFKGLFRRVKIQENFRPAPMLMPAGIDMESVAGVKEADDASD